MSNYLMTILLSEITLDLDRRKIAHRIPIARFNSEHVSRLLMAHLKGPISPELGELVHAKTGGNPFFAEEIIRSLNDDGLLAKSGNSWTLKDSKNIAIPTSVRAILRQRTRKLGDDCVNLLSVASLIGMEFDFEVLKRVTDGTEEASMKLLEAAVRSQLVRERKEGSRVYYVFSDEQVRNYLAEQVSLLRSRKYHRSIGQALEETYNETVDNHAGQIAYHYLQATDTQKAREYSVRAGERSAQLHASSDANMHLLKALELTGEDEPEARLDLLTKLGRAGWARANHKEVLQFCGEGLKIAERLDDRNKIADLYSLMGVSQFILANSPKEAQASLLKGLQALEGTRESEQEAFLCSQLARVYGLIGQADQAQRWVKKAIEIATTLGTYDALSHSYQTLALLLPPKEKAQIIEYYEKALSLALEHGLEDSACRGYINLAACYSILKGLHKRAEDLLAKGIAYAQTAGRIDDEAWMRGELMLTHLAMGQWENCEKEAPEVISLANEVGERSLILPYYALTFIAIAKGDLQRAEGILANIFPIAKRAGWTELLWLCYSLEAQIHLGRKEYDKAESSLLTTLEYSKKDAWGTAAVETLQELVALCLKKTNLGAGSTYYLQLQQLAMELDENWPQALERWANGLMKEAQQEATTAVESLKESISMLRTAERPYYLARVLVDLARLQDKAGLRREGEASLEEAGRIFGQLDITWRLGP